MISTIKKTPTDVRQGENSGRMPIDLGISVLLIVLVFAAAYGYISIFSAHQ